MVFMINGFTSLVKGENREIISTNSYDHAYMISLSTVLVSGPWSPLLALHEHTQRSSCPLVCTRLDDCKNISRRGNCNAMQIP